MKDRGGSFGGCMCACICIHKIDKRSFRSEVQAVAWEEAIFQVEMSRCCGVEADVVSSNIIMSAHERAAAW